MICPTWRRGTREDRRTKPPTKRRASQGTAAHLLHGFVCGSQGGTADGSPLQPLTALSRCLSASHLTVHDSKERHGPGKAPVTAAPVCRNPATTLSFAMTVAAVLTLGRAVASGYEAVQPPQHIRFARHTRKPDLWNERSPI
jgi:hypothetical protein